MKSVKVEFLFDFGSPNAYLRHPLIPAIEARTGARFEYGPILLDGLDAEKILALSQDPEVKNVLLQNTQSAHERGAFGSPSFFVGDQLWFGKDRLRDVEEEVVRVASA